MKNITKILSMLLVVVMCMSFFGGAAFAFEDIGGGSSSGGTQVNEPVPPVTEPSSGSSGFGTVDEGFGAIGSPVVPTSGDVSLMASEDTVAMIGSTTYSSLELAIQSATNGQTIKLMKDYTTVAGLEISGKSLTINLNKFTLTLTAAMDIRGSVTVTLTGGKVSATDIANLETNSKLKLTNVDVDATGTITAPTAKSVTIDGGNYTISSAFFNNAMTIFSGIFNEDPSAYRAAGKDVVDNADGTWTVGTAANVATVNGIGYSTLDAAIKAAPDGATVTVAVRSSSAPLSMDVTAYNSFNKSLTIAIGDNEIETNGELVIPSGKSLKINGTTFTSASGIAVGSNATFEINGSSGLQLTGDVTNNGNFKISAPANVAGAVTNNSTMTITGGANVTSITMGAGSTLTMNNANAVVESIDDTATGRLAVSAGTVNALTASATPVVAVTGGKWAVDPTGYYNANSYQANLDANGLYVVTAKSFNTNEQGTVSSSSYIFYLNTDLSNSNTAMAYTVSVPSGYAYNDYTVSFVNANGQEIGTLNNGDYTLVQTGGASSLKSTFTIVKNASSLKNLPAGLSYVKFTFGNGSTVYSNQKLYVVPKFVIGDATYKKDNNDSLVYTLYGEPNGSEGGYAIANTNSSSKASFINSSNYSETSDGTNTTLSLSTSYLDGLGNGTYYMWYVFADNRVAPMPAFNVNVAGTSTTDPGGGGNPGGGGGSSSGTILVQPVDDAYWYYGDGLLKFRVSELVTSIKVDGFTVGVLNYWNKDDYYISLGTSYLGDLSNGWHTLTVYNDTAEGSCTFYVGPSLVAKNTDKHVTGSSANLQFVCSDGIANVYVGGKALDTSYYGLSADRKTITLYAEFLNNRTAGNTYTLSVDTDGGDTASTTFRILTKAQAAASPQTGDNSNLILWTVAMAMSGAAAVVVVPKLRKHED